jgi:peptidoglycan/xylan/chitin deacetylase (PgdA/CDA1 family)
MHPHRFLSRRGFLGATLAGAAAYGTRGRAASENNSRPDKALVAITLDLEMSAQYPRRDMLEWNFEKGNLDAATKQYAVDAARVARERGGLIHFFCVGRVLEQENVDWLKGIAADGHPVGNHTYDHVYVLAATAEETQFRFRRAPWLVRGQTAEQVIRENIRMTNIALLERTGIEAAGFRTPGGFNNGLRDRPDIQRMLLDLGFPWVSSLYPAHQFGQPMQEPSAEVYADIVAQQAAAQPFVYETGLIEIPMSPISDVGAFRSNYWKLDWFLKAVGLAVDRAIETGGVFDFLAHPSCLVVEDPTFETVKLICDRVRAAGDKAAIVGLDDIARRAAT